MLVAVSQPGVTLSLGALLICVAFCGAVAALLISVSLRRQHRRDCVLAQQWDAMRATQAATPDADLVRVQTVYQRARSGTKAIIVWTASGERQDSWFAGHWPVPGCIALVHGSTGWGPHNRNPRVFYIEHSQVLWLFPPDADVATYRHRRREAKRTNKLSRARRRRRVAAGPR